MTAVRYLLYHLGPIAEEGLGGAAMNRLTGRTNPPPI